MTPTPNENNRRRRRRRRRRKCHVLSIQSQVASGCTFFVCEHSWALCVTVESRVVRFLTLHCADVGLQASTFPLQLLGHDVTVLPTVLFSNHTGYASWTGRRVKVPEWKEWWQGLHATGLQQQQQVLLTGYLGTVALAEELAQHVRAPYICDPVLGDNGKFYVPPELVSVYRQQLIPAATIVTPNHFELEQLVDKSAVRTLQDAHEACLLLHKMGPQLVVVTSLVLDDDDALLETTKETTAAATTDYICGTLTMMASRIINSDDNEQQQQQQEVFTITCPRLDFSFTGTGDLCAALILAHRDKTLPALLERVQNSVWAVLQRTVQIMKEEEEEEEEEPTVTTMHNDDEEETNRRHNREVHQRELRLVECKDVIEDPPLQWKAKRYL